MCERSREGMKTLRNSAENTPPFFITPLFLILREPERLGCLKWNSLRINNRSVISLLEQRSKINHETNLTTQIKHPFETVICSFFVDYNWSIDQWKGPYFGGMFSGLLDQSFTQSSPVFIRISSSLSFSASASSSSSDCNEYKTQRSAMWNAQKHAWLRSNHRHTTPTPKHKTQQPSLVPGGLRQQRWCL